MGAGGLGSPAMLYLAAAGVGTIGIVDFDVVDVSNLQRQVIHRSDRVGMKKTESARADASASSTRTSASWPTRRCSARTTWTRLIEGYDLILDGTDTFETRYTLNDAAVRAGIPVVHASVFRFEGQLTVLQALSGPVLPLPLPDAAAAGAGARAARWPACSASCPESWASSRPPRASRSCSTSATRWRAACSSTTPSTAAFSELQLRRDPHCPACGDGVLAVLDVRWRLPPAASLSAS